MDIRRVGYFGQVTISGVRTPSAHKGSIMGIVAEALKDITANRSRTDESGESEIVIRIRNKPFDTSREGVLLLGKAEELEALVEGDVDQPLENESYEDFYQRLIDNAYAPASAEYIAGQWFNRPVSPETTLWLNDPKAMRFRELNARDEMFESAHPAEYESLKNYVLTTYPEFVKGLVFRTA
jgi:hypothetical protein